VSGPWRFVLGAALVAGAVSCGGDPLDSVRLQAAAAPSAAEARAPAAPDTVHHPYAVLEVVASGLEVPWDMAATPDGRLLVTERPGRIRVVDDRGLRDEPWAAFDVHARDPGWNPETGLLGIALSPDFDRSGHVYVYGVFRKPGLVGSRGLAGRLVRRLLDAVAPLRALPFEGRVYRLTDRDGRATDPVLVVDGIPAFHYHAGGALRFGPDGMLYLTTGDARLPQLSADPEHLTGRILRYRPDGSVPDDNPVAGSPVWARGFRNPQGLAWTREGDLVAIEHGPSGFPNEGGRVGNDELNRVEAGADHGWPRVAGEPAGEGAGEEGAPAGSSAGRPLRVWNPSLAPGGLARVHGPRFPAWEGDLLITGLQRSGQLLRVRLGPDGAGEGGGGLLEEEVLLRDGLGRLRLVSVGPDGSVYLGTSNRSARGRERPSDDRLFRVVRFLDDPPPDA
jgi:glucose/arabinose dehydrogenase